MESLISLKQNCPRHPDREVRYFCLDNACQSSAVLCVLCLKREHPKCKNELLLPKEKLIERTEFFCSDFVKIQIFKNSIKEILEELKTRFSFKLKAVLSSKARRVELAESMDPGSLSDIELVRCIKRGYLPQVQPASSKPIVYMSKLSCTPAEARRSLKVHFKEVEFALREFCQSIGQVSALSSVAARLKVSDFLLHPGIVGVESAGAIVFSRQGSHGSNYFSAIYSLPMDSATFKVTVLNVNSADRFLDMGFLDSTRYEQVVNSGGMVNTFYSTGSYSFCGYSFSFLSGKTPTSSCESELGHSPGKEHFVKISKAKNEISVYNSDLSVDLKKTDLDTSLQYYFFVSLYHEETSCQVELINK